MSIQRRPKTGKPAKGQSVKWVVRYRDPSGREHSKTFTREKDAKAYDDEQARLLRRSEWVDADNAPRLDAVWPLWEAAATSPGTKAVRVTVGANLGDLGPTPITKILPSQLRAWQIQLRDGRRWVDGCTGLAVNTRRSWWAQLSGCLSMAVGDGMMLTNPCSKVPGPGRAEPVDPRALPSIEEIGAAVTRAEKTGRGTLAMMILLGVSTGLRPSEVAGLRWRNVDVKSKAVHVVERSRAVSGKPTDWGPPKTPASRRVVPVPPEMMKRLVTYRLSHPTDADREPIFLRRTGGLWSSGDISSAMSALLGEDAAWTFHALRHVYASSLIRQGRGVKAVQKMMGHKNAATTLDTYTHLWPDEDEMVRDAAQALVRDVCGMGPVVEGLEDDMSGTGSE
ncbi:MAG: site-specific integrase [Corynebacterium nuruki]|nr:site-specific integrase [Corynebacterium nuruki]